MKTTKTSEVIAERMRKRGYDNQMLTWSANGLFDLTVEGEHIDDATSIDGYNVYKATGDTVTAVYKDVERQWREDQ